MSQPTTAVTMTKFFTGLKQISPEDREAKLKELVPLFWQGVEEIARIFREQVEIGKNHLMRIINALSDDIKERLATFKTTTDCHFTAYAKSSLLQTA